MPVQWVESFGSLVRSTDCQRPWPLSFPVPVQVTQTSCTPADGSPVTRVEKVTTPLLTVPRTLLVLGGAARAGWLVPYDVLPSPQ